MKKEKDSLTDGAPTIGPSKKRSSSSAGFNDLSADSDIDGLEPEEIAAIARLNVRFSKHSCSVSLLPKELTHRLIQK